MVIKFTAYMYLDLSFVHTEQYKLILSVSLRVHFSSFEDYLHVKTYDTQSHIIEGPGA